MAADGGSPAALGSLSVSEGICEPDSGSGVNKLEEPRRATPRPGRANADRNLAEWKIVKAVEEAACCEQSE